jgi:hypothetical protein
MEPAGTCSYLFFEPDESIPRPSLLLRDNFNIILPYNTTISKRSLPSDFPTKTLYVFLFSPHPCHASGTWSITLMIPGKDYRSWSSLLWSSSPISCYFVQLRSQYFTQHSVLKHPQSKFFLHVRDQMSRHAKEPCWRWQHYWPKHVGDHYALKLHPYSQAHLLVFRYILCG